jgi:hypothetical protein
MYHRGRTFSDAFPQNDRFSNWQTSFCTTLLLEGASDRLDGRLRCSCYGRYLGKRPISGSYDKTIWLWGITTGEQS